MNWLEATARWYGVLAVLTWGLAPLVRLLCPRLSDRGATIVRPLALLAVVYPTWFLSSVGLIPYSTAGLWLTLAVGSALGWLLVIRHRAIDQAWLRSLVVAEAISLGTFVAYVWLRGYTPQILNTEKPMDIAFLSASARTQVIPALDPWFSGQPINYYDLGYLLHGALSRMAGVPTTVGFNLALATTFSIAATAAAGTAFNAVRPWLSRRRAMVAGTFAPLLLVIAGNLYAPVRYLQTPGQTFAADWWDKLYGIGWRASRIVCDGPRIGNDCKPPSVETINEFPFFSFLLGDLHPHLMALPFAVVALALALNAALRARSPDTVIGASDWLALVFSGVAIGALYALNSWDYPTYLLLVSVAVWVGFRAAGPRRAWLAVLVLVASSVTAWAPFIAGFVPPTGGSVASLPAALRRLPVFPSLLTAFAVHTGERTSIGEFLTIFAVPYALSLWLVGSGLIVEHAREPLRLSRTALVGFLVALSVAVLLPLPLLANCGLPLAGTIFLLRRQPSLSPRTVALALFTLGFALILGVELIYIRDVFNSRMNTLFKIYYQIWTLFAIGAAVTIVIIWTEALPRRLARPALTLYVLLALLSSALYPALASYRWTGEFQRWRGLDGIAYVAEDDPAELAAIRWLQIHARSDDVLLEAPGCSYQPISQLPFDRASAFTGVPTIIGWENHERQWRSGEPGLLRDIAQRQEDARNIFANPNGELAQRYGISLIYVGRYEREAFDCPVAGPFGAALAPNYPGAGWTLGFEQGNVRIFRRGVPTGTDVAPMSGTPSA